MIAVTTNEDFITECVTHPAVWVAMKDDGAPDREFYFPPINPSVIWVRVDDYGVFALHRQNHVTYECHTILLPEARGKAVDIGKEALKFAFEELGVLRIVTNVPAFNVHALRLALKVGFKEIGINKKSFQVNGILYDQHFLGISKEDLCLS